MKNVEYGRGALFLENQQQMDFKTLKKIQKKEWETAQVKKIY